MIQKFPTNPDWRRITRRIAFEHGCQKAAAASVGMSCSAFRRYSAGRSSQPLYSFAARILNCSARLMPCRYREFTGCDYVPLPEQVDWKSVVAMIKASKTGLEFTVLFDDETWSAYRTIGNERRSPIYDPFWRNAALAFNYLTRVDGGTDWLDELNMRRRAVA